MAIKKAQIVCGKCKKPQSETNFYLSKSDIHQATGKLPVCKDCMGQIYEHYFNKYQNEKMALYYMCRKIDICYNESSYNGVMNELAKGSNTLVWRVYMTKLNSLGGKNGAGFTFDDSDEIEKIVVEKQINNEFISNEVIAFWGKGFTEEEYLFLNNEYDTLCQRYESDSYSSEVLFQEIACQRLDIKKKRQIGASVDKELKTLQDLLGSANIKPVQETGANSTEQATFGTLIKKWENEEPIPEPLEKWEEHDWIKKYVLVWFLGHLSKMMNVKNKFSDMYDDEMSKYTVEMEDEENSSTDEETGEGE